MDRMIESQNPMFKGKMVCEPLPVAALLFDPDGFAIYKCPTCGELMTKDDADCLGAEADCIFCTRCHREIRPM